MAFHNDPYAVGERAEHAAIPEQIEPGPFRKSRPPEPLRFEVNMVAEACNRQQKTGTVQVNIPGFSPVTLYCDEQPPVGDDAAPPPLAFFTAGIGFCLMTHLTDILTARKIAVWVNVFVGLVDGFEDFLRERDAANRALDPDAGTPTDAVPERASRL